MGKKTGDQSWSGCWLLGTEHPLLPHRGSVQEPAPGRHRARGAGYAKTHPHPSPPASCIPVSADPGQAAPPEPSLNHPDRHAGSANPGHGGALAYPKCACACAHECTGVIPAPSACKSMCRAELGKGMCALVPALVPGRLGVLVRAARPAAPCTLKGSGARAWARRGERGCGGVTETRVHPPGVRGRQRSAKQKQLEHIWLPSEGLQNILRRRRDRKERVKLLLGRS